jgi:hypothetical protein
MQAIHGVVVEQIDLLTMPKEAVQAIMLTKEAEVSTGMLITLRLLQQTP